MSSVGKNATTQLVEVFTTPSILYRKFRMNLLLIESSEIADREVEVSGRRARHLLQVLQVKVGDRLRVGIVQGEIGTAIVVAVTNKTVRLQIESTTMPPCGLDIELILALPRPIMLQRILKQGTVLGIRRFHLIRSRRVEKSFFQSPVLAPEKIKTLLWEGMEQAMDTWLPEVHIHTRFKPFVEDVLPDLKGVGLLAHPDAKHSLPALQQTVQHSARLLLAVGPEGGWNDFEVESFVVQGFETFSMGNRILHVDTAVVSLLAQIQLLYDMQ